MLESNRRGSRTWSGRADLAYGFDLAIRQLISHCRRLDVGRRLQKRPFFLTMEALALGPRLAEVITQSPKRQSNNE